MAWKVDLKNIDVKKIITWLQIHITPMSAETLGWLAVVLIHSATIPTLLAVLTGLSDRMPTVDLVLLTWAGLTALFAQACVQRNMLQIVTIAGGFIMQASLMALIFFK
jgi:hypothetical protein